MIHLRDYQSSAIGAIRQAYRDGKRWPLFVLPTGGGKTVCFAHIAHGAASKSKRVMLIAHRIELIDQISDALKAENCPHSFIAAGYDFNPDAAVHIASIQTLIRRLDAVAPPDMLIIDEAHHALAETWRKVIAHYPRAFGLGVTATPCRTSGAGLGHIFDRLILGPTVTELTARGYLVPARIFSPPSIDTSGLHIRMGDFVQREAEAAADKPSVTGDALDHYRKHAAGKRALIFTVSIEHAQHVAQQFRAAGISAIHLHGGTSRDIRRQALQDFRDGKILAMASCDLFGEGLDIPAVECGILLRPTASLSLYQQQVGRCLRPYPGKSHAVILDHAGNTMRFGMPDEARDWTLEGEITAKRKRPASISVRICIRCFSASRNGTRVCSNCGEAFPIQAREVEHRKGELIEITPEQIQHRRERQMQGRARTLEQLQEFGRMKGYSPNWALKVWQGRQAKIGSR